MMFNLEFPVITAMMGIWICYSEQSAGAKKRKGLVWNKSPGGLVRLMLYNKSSVKKNLVTWNLSLWREMSLYNNISVNCHFDRTTDI